MTEQMEVKKMDMSAWKRPRADGSTGLTDGIADGAWR